MSEIRVRFAPSPTGSVHIGNIRAAIFNYLFARHNGGKFLVRIEDTDLARSTPEAIRKVLEALEWLGMEHDEEIVYQTHNLADHLAAVERLIASGHAYRAEKTSADGKTGEVVLFRIPQNEEIEFQDLVKGRMRKKSKDMQDFVIVRSDGSPVFHIANVVDDIKQGITHIIRGDDHVENTFKHILMFRALGAAVPCYAHLPMIVNNAGKPYSKRDGAAFVGEFKEQGYLADALFNFLLLLGWAPGDDREVLTREEMISLFSLEKCKSSPARFDMKKLLWMNGEYIRTQKRDEFKKEFLSRLENAGLGVGDADLDGILEQMQIRTRFYGEIPANCAYFFTDDYSYNSKGVEKRLRADGAAAALEEALAEFKKLEIFNRETSHDCIAALAAAKEVNMGLYIHPVRVAVSGLTEGPGLFEMLELLGRGKVIARIEKTLAILRNGDIFPGCEQ